MLRKLLQFSLLSGATLVLLASPAHADTAVVQQGTQDLVVDGAGNHAVQESSQVNYNRDVNSKNSNGNTGIVQDNYQRGAVFGEDNGTYQGNSQVNVTEKINEVRNRKRYNF
jgi:hypothetical protein